MELFAERLKLLRGFKNKTLDEMAKELETTKTTLSRYENSLRTPDAIFVAKLATYFKVSADYLLCLTDNPLTVNDLLYSKRINVSDLNEVEVLDVEKFIANIRSNRKL